jgi:hypothetical protein
MIGRQIVFPAKLQTQAGALGLQQVVWGKPGPQGNPMGSAAPRPYPSRDPSAGTLVSFGHKVYATPYGAANWLAHVLPGVGTRSSELSNTYYQPGLIKNVIPLTSF